MMSNCEWNRGEVPANFRQPFDFLAETAAAVATGKAQGAKLSTGHCPSREMGDSSFRIDVDCTPSVRQ
ncbi:hypothetical protein EN836_19425 [Mesorhizobium sp. M1C.F.Ca.ET.193.01.1.1]|nr:hypothetical protein EN853_19420 [Mesorhizobium sp. M1C.F.Ca.ET.210.01.1.1]TGQ68925.1 hypothetical protein EN855_019430 [Mesorhizobium sp. M1C.F.Ca.ET.212.01.1.1]TGR04478.1 hypothetical protein EN847_19425 [Mesorhizobium sp. M1C.F.Ca.ET.204.01.1.1]TGR25245.1 hypothetical protein EN839_19425 [Mesorhizobium sp. M1C.F.Ca.ET.196.01.1.1]TGR47977.1 hypothetical protein EN838_19420 [Mesorhizobium sp. M1C.F.Ca.ET.195.01.1.1]TGR63379.1 hypothetical protein EN835_019415 [Mesorhizobium sp. M1C.F.Ca.ET